MMAASMKSSQHDMHVSFRTAPDGRLFCAGIAFAGVHDSFWTHAADVPVLARLLREAFVQVHSQPLLHTLRAELEEGMQQAGSNAKLIEPPMLGNLNLNKVLDAEYFFN